MPPAQNTTQTQRGPSSNAAPAGARARRAPAPEEAQELQAELQKLDPEIHAAEGLSEAPSVAAPSAAASVDRRRWRLRRVLTGAVLFRRCRSWGARVEGS